MSEQTTIKGRVIHIEQPQSFGASGFRKATVVIETGGDYPQQIPIEFVKDKADEMASKLSVGMEVEIAYNLRGREWNGRYFASVQGWRFDIVSTVDSGGSAVDSSESADDDIF